ncbi:MAG: Beta-phosphoglucomutase [candidate division WS6 bacterium OLB20]|uniref:Beta-phosphoglucomutase n=1 Tax=candidate division WS6 bacterium OLB20 TaxID=1617426 RepID=A0A136M128_9BACT|nr:MAG: Beta-phosphoglucomutase [candidate division WS6 bacterium OLB20]
MAEIKAVVFDLDGVYFEGGTETYISSLVNKYGLSKQDIVDVYLKSEEMQRYKCGVISSEEYWNYAISTWEIDATREELVELLISSYNTNPDTVSFVETLRDQGIKTAICTNNFPDRFESLKERFNLSASFDVIVTSYEEGITKPSPQIFQTLASRLDLKPNEILMSDDHEVNVEALKQLGFDAFLYTNLDEFKSYVTERIDT